MTAFLVLVAGAFLNVVAVTAIGYVQEGGFAAFVAIREGGRTVGAGKVIKILK